MSARQLYVRTARQGPAEIVDYTLDWSKVLDSIDDAILDCQHTVTHYDDGEGDGHMWVWRSQFTPADTTVWLTGGVLGEKYVATTTVTTRDDRVFVRSELIRCVKR